MDVLKKKNDSLTILDLNLEKYYSCILRSDKIGKRDLERNLGEKGRIQIVL